MAFMELEGFIENGMEVNTNGEETIVKEPVKLGYITKDLNVKVIDGFFVKSGYGYYEPSELPDGISKPKNVDYEGDLENLHKTANILKEFLEKGFVKGIYAENTVKTYAEEAIYWLKEKKGVIGFKVCRKNGTTHAIFIKDEVGSIKGIPSEYKGFVIGKGGAKIKELAKNFNLKVIKLLD